MIGRASKVIVLFACSDEQKEMRREYDGGKMDAVMVSRVDTENAKNRQERAMNRN